MPHLNTLLFILVTVCIVVFVNASSLPPSRDRDQKGDGIFMALIVSTLICLVGILAFAVWGGHRGPQVNHTYGGGW
jgi:hypothetical protein